MKKILSSLSAIQKAIHTGSLFVLVMIALGTIWLVYSFWSNYSHQNMKLREKEQLVSELQTKLDAQKADLERKTKKIETLNGIIADQKEKIQQLETQIHLLKVKNRVARLSVLAQQQDPSTGTIKTTVRFVELNEEGNMIGEPREYTVEGEVVYVDGWIVKFQDKYVQKSILPRSSSVILFHRIYGQKQSPDSGYRLDTYGTVPLPYRENDSGTSLLRSIFSDFWNVANSPSRQEELGIRAAHGTAGYIKAKPGKTYRVSLRASGDVSILPVDQAEANE